MISSKLLKVDFGSMAKSKHSLMRINVALITF